MEIAENSGSPRVNRPIEKLGYSIDEAVQATPLGKSTLYAMMSAGSLRYKQVGDRRIIPASALRELVGEE